jgi:putative DNA primase/helicase
MRETKWAATDRWPEILLALGVPKATLVDRHGPCPGCGGEDRFRFDNKKGRGTFICSQGGGEPLSGDGFSLLHHVFGWNFKQAIEEVARVLGTLPQDYDLPKEDKPLPAKSRAPAPAEKKAEQSEKERVAKARQAIEKLWRNSVPLREMPAAIAYFENRHIPFDLIANARDVRGIPDLPYWYRHANGEWEDLGSYPALIALCRGPTKQVLAVHRTWLAPDGSGKLALPDPERPKRADGQPNLLDARKLTTPIVRRVPLHIELRPMQSDGRLGVGEGIETALAASLAHHGIAVHATVNSGNMGGRAIGERVIGGYTPPPTCKKLLIFTDNDPAGIQAARYLQERMKLSRKDLAVDIRLPNAGNDWADVLKMVAEKYPDQVAALRKEQGLGPAPQLPMRVLARPREYRRDPEPHRATSRAQPQQLARKPQR